MMKIEKVVGDLILLVLDNHEPLKKIGIDQDKIFVKVKGYDENGMWIHHPGFQVPNFDNGNNFIILNADAPAADPSRKRIECT